MRFTKQLTALTCALALFAGGAHAREPNSCDNSQRIDFVDAFSLSLELIFGSKKCETIGYTTTPAYEAVKTIETAPTEEVMKSALEAVEEGTMIMLFSSLRGGSFMDIKNENKKSILGIAANGQKTRVHCPTTCTAGSLNRTAIQQGLPFMVPYEVLRHVEERSEIGRTKAWHDVAAIIWSKEYSYNFPYDRNAEMSRDYQVDRPDIHAARSAAKNISDNKQQSNGASDIKVTDGGTTADVVEVAAEECDAFCESEKM